MFFKCGECKCQYAYTKIVGTKDIILLNEKFWGNTHACCTSIDISNYSKNNLTAYLVSI